MIPEPVPDGPAGSSALLPGTVVLAVGPTTTSPGLARLPAAATGFLPTSFGSASGPTSVAFMTSKCGPTLMAPVATRVPCRTTGVVVLVAVARRALAIASPLRELIENTGITTSTGTLSSGFPIDQSMSIDLSFGAHCRVYNAPRKGMGRGSFYPLSRSRPDI